MNKGVWRTGLCFLLAASMIIASQMSVFADGPGDYEYWDNEHVHYYYYPKTENEVTKYFREGIKDIRLSPYTYYDTMYKPAKKESSWKNISTKEEADKAAAKAVDDMIDTLPADSGDIVLDDEYQIRAVEKAYIALSSAQKNYVTAAKKRLLDEDLAAVKNIKEALKSAGGVRKVKEYLTTLTHCNFSETSTVEEIVDAATTTRQIRLAYEVLSDEQRHDILEAAYEDDEIMDGLRKIGYNPPPDGTNPLEVRAIKALWSLSPAFPAGYPDFDEDAYKTAAGIDEETYSQRLDDWAERAEIILNLYKRLNVSQSVEIDSGAELRALTETIPEEKPDDDSVIDEDGDPDKKLNTAFLNQMVSNYLLEDWAYLADKIFSTQGEAANYYGNSNYKSYYSGSKPKRGMNVAAALASPSGGQSSKWGDDDAWRYTGLKAATSLSQVRNAMADEVRSGANRKAVTRSEILDKSEITISKDRLEGLKKDDKTKAFYSIATYVERDTSSVLIKYQSYGLCFYDFDLAVIADDSIDYITGAEEYNDGKPEGIRRASMNPSTGVHYKSSGSEGAESLGYAENNTPESAQVSMTLTDKESTSLSTSFTTTETYKYSEMVGSETRFGGNNDMYGEIIKVQFTSEQAYSTARGKTNTAVREFDHTITTSRTIPGHAAAQISTCEDNMQVTVPYDTPTAITFKVAIFSIGGEGTCTAVSSNFIQDIAGYETSDFYTTFGTESTEGGLNAQENLRRRAVTNKEIGGFDQSYGNVSGVLKNVGGRRTEIDQITWKGNLSADESKAINAMTCNIPMAAAGTTVDVDKKQLISKVEAIIPLYLLTDVKLAAGVPDEYDMNPGDTLSLDNLALKGVNSYGVDYYGFSQSDGHWEFCDENGKTSERSPYAEITTNKNGKATLTAIEPPDESGGSQYIKWVLNNDTSYTAYKESGRASNLNINTAYVKINVTDKPFAGSISLDGEYTGYVGDPPVSLPAAGLDVMVQSSEGEVSRPVKWKAKELESRGIILTEDGKVSFTKPGEFHVRVYTGSGSDKVWSTSGENEWLTIRAEDAKKLDSISIEDETKPETLGTFVLNDGDNLVRLSNLTVKAEDQYGSDWDLQPEDITWKVNGHAIEGSDFQVSKAGTYKIAATSGKVTSNALTLEVKEARRLDTLVIANDDLTPDGKGLGVGSGYEISLVTADGEIQVTALDQYGKTYDISSENPEWKCDERYSVISGGRMLKGKADTDSAKGWLQLTAGPEGGRISSNKLEFRVSTLPYVSKLYGADNKVIEGQKFPVNDIRMTAKDQENKIYKMSDEEIASIVWSLDPDKGTIKEASGPDSAGAIYDAEERILRVSEGTLEDGETGSVALKGSFTNPNGTTVAATALISVEQKPVLKSLELTAKSDGKEIVSGTSIYCRDYFDLIGKDQYGNEFDLDRQPLSVTCDNSEAFTVKDADDFNSCILKAGKSKKTANITVSTENSRDEDVTSNALMIRVARVRALQSLNFTGIPDNIPLGQKVSLDDFGAVCYDDEGVPYSAEELEKYPAVIRYSFNSNDTDARLDTARNIITSGSIYGPVTVSASAADVDSNVIMDEDGNEIRRETEVWVGPKPEKLITEPAEICGDGALSRLTVTGKWLADGMKISVCGPDGKETLLETSGTSKNQSAEYDFPRNSTDEEQVYKIAYLNGNEKVAGSEINVIVKPHRLSRVAAIKASCTEDGNTEYWKCSECGKIYSDSKADRKLAAEQIVVAAHGHSWDEGKVSKEASEDASGIYTYTCEYDHSHQKKVRIPVLLLSSKAYAHSIKYSWTEVDQADGYELYFAKCNSSSKEYQIKKIMTFKDPDTLKWTRKKLKNHTDYKAYIMAYSIENGRKVYLAKSYTTHSLTGNRSGRFANAKSVKAASKSISAAAGSSVRIRNIKLTLARKNKKQLSHEKNLRYAVSNAAIASVSADGTVKCIRPGKCTVYVIAVNGERTAIKLKVK